MEERENELITKDEQKTILRANEIVKCGCDDDDDINLILQVLVNIIEKLKDRIREQNKAIQNLDSQIIRKEQELSKEHDKLIYQNAKIELLKGFLGGNEWID